MDLVVQKSPSGLARSRLFVVRGEANPQPPEISDADLIDAFARGEGHACEAIYDRLIAVVESTLFRVLGRRDSAHDDLVQSAFEQIVVTLTRSRFARACSLSSWAASVTTYVAFNAMRARSRERRLVDHARDADAEARTRGDPRDLESDAHAREMLRRVRAELARMSIDQATTLFLHDVLGHELPEIAALTNVSVTAAQSRLVRGRKELQKRLLKGTRRKAGKP